MKIGLTFANLKALGNMLKDMERLKISVTGLARTLAQSFRNLPGSLSMPAAFEMSISLKMLTEKVYNLFLLVVIQSF